MGRGAWWGAVHRVTKSQTNLKPYHAHTHSHQIAPSNSRILDDCVNFRELSQTGFRVGSTTQWNHVSQIYYMGIKNI